MQGVTHSNRALLASSTKTAAIEVNPQNYNKTTMYRNGELPHSPKSLSRIPFDHLQPIRRERLLTCLLHFSLRVKGIMISVVSQMLRKDLNSLRDLNISDPRHPCCYILSQRTFKHHYFALPSTIFHNRNLGGLSYHSQRYSISRNPGGLSNLPHFSYHPQQYSIPIGVLAIVNSINLSSCLCVPSGENLMGGSQHMWPLIP